MNILWIADFSLRHNAGGAQRSDNILIEAGRDMGLSITEFNYDTHPSVIGKQYDAIVSANLEQMSRSHVGLFEFICSHPRHFRVEHDANRYLHPEARKNLFGSCRKCFFLTQFHLDQFEYQESRPSALKLHLFLVLYNNPVGEQGQTEIVMERKLSQHE